MTKAASAYTAAAAAAAKNNNKQPITKNKPWLINRLIDSNLFLFCRLFYASKKKKKKQ